MRKVEQLLRYQKVLNKVMVLEIVTVVLCINNKAILTARKTFFSELSRKK